MPASTNFEQVLSRTISNAAVERYTTAAESIVSRLTRSTQTDKVDDCLQKEICLETPNNSILAARVSRRGASVDEDPQYGDKDTFLNRTCSLKSIQVHRAVLAFSVLPHVVAKAVLNGHTTYEKTVG